ncbi:hypothetical protein [Mangrovicoccus ximenensis]|uniref:hypothetical protein n=1 Tax=Mangrovicoccus ximenensis TaxID=1911570 RepID=UPI001F3D7818|nr:hypothetical protein [Mangrovicoccus ximenensis]
MAEVAARACDRSGSGYRLEADGTLSAEARASILKRLAGGDIGGEAEISASRWEGVEQVLREHRLEQSLDENACIQQMMQMLIDYESRRQSLAPPPAPAPAQPDGKYGARCIEIAPGAEMMLPVRRNMCLTGIAGKGLALIKRADPSVVVYSSAAGQTVSCYEGDSCSFGWDGSPVFTLRTMNGTPYLVSGD